MNKYIQSAYCFMTAEATSDNVMVGVNSWVAQLLLIDCLLNG